MSIEVGAGDPLWKLFAQLDMMGQRLGEPDSEAGEPSGLKDLTDEDLTQLENDAIESNNEISNLLEAIKIDRFRREQEELRAIEDMRTVADMPPAAKQLADPIGVSDSEAGEPSGLKDLTDEDLTQLENYAIECENEISNLLEAIKIDRFRREQEELRSIELQQIYNDMPPDLR